MGCSSPVDTMRNMFLINEFNKKYLECDDNNTEIEIDSDKDSRKSCTFHKIGQTGFESLCKLKIPNIQMLYLSNNEISNINCLKSFKAPYLSKLDLSYNKIKEINILKEVNYPNLKTLDLRNNKINDISIFKIIFKEDINLKKLRIIELKNNELDFNDPKNQNIMKIIRNRLIENGNEVSNISDSSYNYQIELKKIKTLNKIISNSTEITKEQID